jgi:uncharacterized protein with FMN-binding domain
MTNPLRTASLNTRGARTAFIALAGISAIGTLAGCSATPAASSGTAAGGGSEATTTSSNANYKDGTYSEPGDYVSPGGTERINVTLTLSKNVITKMKVVTVHADPTATSYEQLFESGIGAATVGKNINSLNIGVVAGSSLTSMGFNKALAAIKADAKS